MKLTEIVTLLSFTQSKANYSMFTKGQDSDFIVLLIYVDDNLIAGPNIQLINSFKQELSNHFKLRDLGTLKYFLGID